MLLCLQISCHEILDDNAALPAVIVQTEILEHLRGINPRPNQ